MSAPLLIEVGCEELPASVCRSFLAQLRGDGQRPGLVYRLFREFRLLGPEAVAEQQEFLPGALDVMVSPRRIGVLVAGVPDRQTAETHRFRGPRATVAFDGEGRPTKAGLGFARSRGVAPEELRREVSDGTEFAVAVVEAERRPAAEVVPDLVARLIGGLQVPRGMRWDKRPAGAEEYLRFSRPIRWLVCKHGAETIEFTFYGLRCGDVSQGHRVLGAPVVIDRADHYRDHLHDQKVVADQEHRRELIVSGLDALAGRLNGLWSDPGEVLDEAVYLAEWPSVEQGRFDRRHLRLPDAVLITAMQSHQRYFPVRDVAGELLPVFLYVSNADPKVAAVVTRGNECVLEGRLDDAEFSYDRDVAEGLPAMAARLDDVVFHEKLGSLAAKALRLEKLAAALARQAAGSAGKRAEVPGTVESSAAQAARLAKADLVSRMVIEFPTLQGVMGGVYATAAGLPGGVARAIAEQYLPVSATAPLPGSLAGALLAVADKVDNITGAWVTGEKPSGSRDPYGLRRAAMGVVRIALEHDLRLAVRDVIAWGVDGYARQGIEPPDPAAAAREMEEFIWERLQGLLLDEGLPFPLVEAALGVVSAAADAARTAPDAARTAPNAARTAPDAARTAPDIPTVAALARMFARIAGESFFDDVVVVYTRCSSLAATAAGTGEAGVDPGLFVVPAESDLHAAVQAVRERVRGALESDDLEAALRATAGLRPAVARYFDDVLVMDEDVAVRANRLAQLKEITVLLGAFGDFSRLPVQGA